ncbi:MAG: DUF6639 family protein [Roseovarius sp.]|nr:DUF6639 family protein [Roseovarius sp.]
MHALKAATAVLMLLSWSAQAEPVSCDSFDVRVNAERAQDAQLTCAAVARANQTFDSCNIPPITRPLRIDLVETLKANCFGQYHCGENWIELLSPSAMQAKHLPQSIYADLPNEAFFQSILVHEMTHAVTTDVPCPFDNCLVTHEYLAYVMQIMSLSPKARLQFLKGVDLDRKISRDELNSIIYFMAPDLFARKAWLHFTQRDDPCGFVGQIVEGTVLLDYERFD